MSKHFLESLFGAKMPDLPDDVFESDLTHLFEEAAEEEEYQMKSSKSPLQTVLSALGISGDFKEQVGCVCVTLPDGEAFHEASRLLSDPDNIYKLAEKGWVAAKQGDIAMTNEPAEYVISFLDIAEVEANDSDTAPDLADIVKKARAADYEEPPHDDKMNPVENPRDLKGSKEKGVGKAQDGPAPKGKIKDSRAAAIVANVLECNATDGKSPGMAKKPTPKGVPGRPKKLPKELKKVAEGALPEPPLNEMTSTGSMGSVPSPVGAKEMYEPGRGLETKGSGGKKLGRKFKMPGQWNQTPAITPKPKKK